MHQQCTRFLSRIWQHCHAAVVAGCAHDHYFRDGALSSSGITAGHNAKVQPARGKVIIDCCWDSIPINDWGAQRLMVYMALLLHMLLQPSSFYATVDDGIIKVDVLRDSHKLLVTPNR
jgi:hypothetical protein